MTKVVSFNGVEIPAFAKVTGISFSALADVDVRETEVPRRYGNVDNGVKFGGKQITLSLSLVIPKGSNIHDMADNLKVWLRGDNWKPSRLTFAEQPNKYILARVSNAVDIDDLFLYGEAEIVFYAANPVKYDVKETVATSATGSLDVNYTGLEKAPSIITLTVSADCTNLKIRHTPSFREIKLKGNFKIGQTVSLNSDSKIVKVNDSVTMDLLEFTSQWINLESGSNNFKLTTTPANAVSSLKVSYRKAD